MTAEKSEISSILQLLLSIIRALNMGSCLSSDWWNRSPQPQPPFQQSWRARSNGSAAEPKSEATPKIPGRMFANGASSMASMFTQQGRKGINQDAMLVWQKDTVFCGVFDGHGPNGHLVARKVRDSLPQKLWSQWQAGTRIENNESEANGQMKAMNSDDSVITSRDGVSKGATSQKLPELFDTLKDSFIKAFRVMDKELKLHPSLDCFCSGTTAVTMIKQGQDLVIGNIGDSRAILGTRIDENTMDAVQLTVDLKPNLPREAERIRKCRGRVFALQDEPEVARVWLPNSDSPRLAMARAFGDFYLKDFGLISAPDVSYRRLTDKDEFIVLATDGMWDVLLNKDVVNIVSSVPSRRTATRALVENAVRAWKTKYPTSKVDDSAVVRLFLNDISTPEDKKSITSQPKSQPLSNGISAQTKATLAQVIVKDQSAVELLLDRANSVRTAAALKDGEKSQSQRRLSDCIEPEYCEEWSALDGVTRVNTLLNMPRFIGRPSKIEELRTLLNYYRSTMVHL